MKPDSSQHENVIIIGGGPAGLSAAIYNARAGLNPLVFAGSPPGGQLILTSEIENFPGYKNILGPELIEKFRDQAKTFGTKIVDENVVDVDFSTNPFTVVSSGSTHRSKSILIATGAKALWLGLESEKKLRGKGVSACATCDGFFFRNKTVAVVGGGDTAMEDAYTLTKFATKVYVIHRRDEFRASKIIVNRVVNHPKVEVIYNAMVKEIEGNMKVEGVVLIVDGKEQKISLDGVFIAIGHKPDTELFKKYIEIDEKGYILTKNRLAYEYLIKGKITSKKLDHIRSEQHHYGSSTSVLGVFAAGDCVDDQYRQASTAAGMGVAASLDIERYLTH